MMGKILNSMLHQNTSFINMYVSAVVHIYLFKVNWGKGSLLTPCIRLYAFVRYVKRVDELNLFVFVSFFTLYVLLQLLSLTLQT